MVVLTERIHNVQIAPVGTTKKHPMLAPALLVQLVIIVHRVLHERCVVPQEHTRILFNNRTAKCATVERCKAMKGKILVWSAARAIFVPPEPHNKSSAHKEPFARRDLAFQSASKVATSLSMPVEFWC